MAVKFINPASGSDANSGDSSNTAWATLGQAATFMTANPGVVTELLIDTSAAPLYLTSSPSFPAGETCTIKSATGDYADIRAWQLVEGDTAVLYDTKYSSSGHPNIWVLVTRANAGIWEYGGGRGDDLIWFGHLKELITPSATFDNATNLSTLNDNAWTFWTGSDGVDQVTLFNPNGSPAGREFAVSRIINAVKVSGPYTLDKLCVGGTSGITATGTLQAGYLIHVNNGTTVNNCIPYAGGTHNIGQLESGAACTFNDVSIGVGPRWAGAGNYTPFIFHCDTGTAGAPTLTRCRCDYTFSVRGSKTGAAVDTLNIRGNTTYCHGSGTCSTTMLVEYCTFDAVCHLSQNAASFSPTLVVRDSVIGGMAITSTSSALIATCDRSMVTLMALSQAGHDSNETTFTDCLFNLTYAPLNSSQTPLVRGIVNFQSCTIRCPGLTAGNGDQAARSILRSANGTLTSLEILDCILELINSSNQVCQLTWSLNLDEGDTLTTDRNLYRTVATGSAVHNNLTTGASSSSRTFAQTQSVLGQEAVGVQYTDNNTLKLGTDHRVGEGSSAIGKPPVRVGAADRTGQIFAERRTSGAFEYGDFRLSGSKLGIRSALII